MIFRLLPVKSAERPPSEAELEELNVLTFGDDVVIEHLNKYRNY